MKKVAKNIAEAAAFVCAVFAAAFMVPLQSGAGYRRQVSRVTARILGKPQLISTEAGVTETESVGFITAPGGHPVQLTIVADNSVAKPARRNTPATRVINMTLANQV